MRIFVYEHVTGGGCAGDALPGYLADGEVMWRAMLADLTAIPGVEVISLRDDRLAMPAFPGAQVIATRADRFADDFRRCLADSDAVWLVAPESGGLLAALSEAVLRAGKRLLSSRPEGVRIAASKTATAAHLAARGIAVIPVHASPYLMVEECAVVMKPDDGVGCQDTRLFPSLEAAEDWTLAHPCENRVFQPFVAGPARSLSLLCRDGYAQLLAVNRQHVSLNAGRFDFHGVSVNDLPDRDGRYADLADRVAAAMPDLWGHVGVDFIETLRGPVVVEVNPRLTASYAGLRESLACNPAQRLLELPIFTALPGRRPIRLESAHVH